MKMGLLKSVDNVPGIDYYDYREYDYYDKFKYRARFKLPGVRFTYWAKNIDEWKDRVENSRWGFTRSKPTLQEKQTILQYAPNVEKFLELKQLFKKNKNGIIRIEGETTAIFSNDLNFLHSLNSWTLETDYTEVQKSAIIGTKFFVKEPLRKYRVYLKSRRVDQSLNKELNELFARQKSLIPSKALKLWTTNTVSSPWRSRFLSSAYFIEYDDESTLSYLALMYPDILGRRYKLEKRPEDN